MKNYIKIFYFIVLLILNYNFIFSQESLDAIDNALDSVEQIAERQIEIENVAEQAYNRKLNIYGVYWLKYDYVEFNKNNESNTVYSHISNLLQIYFNYKISRKISLNFALAWGGYFGSGRASVYYQGDSGQVPSSLEALSYAEYYDSSINKDLENGIGKIAVKQLYLNIKLSREIEISIGRMESIWGYNSVWYLSASGADMVRFKRKLKINSNVKIITKVSFELRKDTSIDYGDEQCFVAMSNLLTFRNNKLKFVNLDIGYFIPSAEVAVNGKAGYDILKDKLGGAYSGILYYAPNGLLINTAAWPGMARQDWWKLLLIDLTVELHLTKKIKLNLDVNFSYGFAGRYVDITGAGYVGDKIKWNTLSVLLNSIIHIWIIKLKPEIVFITAPAKKVGDFGFITPSAEGVDAVGWFVNAKEYEIGGRLMNRIWPKWKPGLEAGLLCFSLELTIVLIKSKLNAFIKPVFSFAVSKYHRYFSNVQYWDAYIEKDNSRNYGFEIDAGFNVFINEKIKFNTEFDFWLPGRRARDQAHSDLSEGNVDGLQFGFMFEVIFLF